MAAEIRQQIKTHVINGVEKLGLGSADTQGNLVPNWGHIAEAAAAGLAVLTAVGAKTIEHYKSTHPELQDATTPQILWHMAHPDNRKSALSSLVQNTRSVSHDAIDSLSRRGHGWVDTAHDRFSPSSAPRFTTVQLDDLPEDSTPVADNGTDQTTPTLSKDGTLLPPATGPIIIPGDSRVMSPAASQDQKPSRVSFALVQMPQALHRRVYARAEPLRIPVSSAFNRFSDWFWSPAANDHHPSRMAMWWDSRRRASA